MKVLFACPQCESPSGVALDHAKDWLCPACGHSAHFDAPDPALPRCAVCGNHELYKQKDFPHRLGLTLLVLAFIASFITYGLYQPWLTWGILIGTALFDGVLYAMVGDALVCYRCHAYHKGFKAGPQHQPHEITIGERYRQERLRRGK